MCLRSKIRGGLEGPNRPAVLPPRPVSASNPPKREPEPKGGKGGKKGKKGKKARAKSAAVFSRKEVDLVRGRLVVAPPKS